MLQIGALLHCGNGLKNGEQVFFGIRSGQYKRDNSGMYRADGAGSYVRDERGKSRPDGSGQYRPDSAGMYVKDDRGKYNKLKYSSNTTVISLSFYLR